MNESSWMTLNHNSHKHSRYPTFYNKKANTAWCTSYVWFLCRTPLIWLMQTIIWRMVTDGIAGHMMPTSPKGLDCFSISPSLVRKQTSSVIERDEWRRTTDGKGWGSPGGKKKNILGEWFSEGLSLESTELCGLGNMLKFSNQTLTLHLLVIHGECLCAVLSSKQQRERGRYLVVPLGQIWVQSATSDHWPMASLGFQWPNPQQAETTWFHTSR